MDSLLQIKGDCISCIGTIYFYRRGVASWSYTINDEDIEKANNEVECKCYVSGIMNSTGAVISTDAFLFNSYKADNENNIYQSYNQGDYRQEDVYIKKIELNNNGITLVPITDSSFSPTDRNYFRGYFRIFEYKDQNRTYVSQTPDIGWSPDCKIVSFRYEKNNPSSESYYLRGVNNDWLWFQGKWFMKLQDVHFGVQNYFPLTITPQTNKCAFYAKGLINISLVQFGANYTMGTYFNNVQFYGYGFQRDNIYISLSSTCYKLGNDATFCPRKDGSYYEVCIHDVIINGKIFVPYAIQDKNETRVQGKCRLHVIGSENADDSDNKPNMDDKPNVFKAVKQVPSLKLQADETKLFTTADETVIHYHDDGTYRLRNRSSSPYYYESPLFAPFIKLDNVIFKMSNQIL